jgi:MoxR-like ATPase
LAKTLVVRTLAASLKLTFRRIQFTPDLLPADVLGTQIYNPRTGEFTVKRGPIFAQVVLADEINRAPAKVQSALLEAMQEQQVTLGEETHILPVPFLVLATQNPIEHEGTYALPEAQVDRFLLKIVLDYPSRDEELTILEKRARVTLQDEIQPLLGGEEILHLRQLVDALYLDAKLKNYMVDLVGATRSPDRFGLDLKSKIQYGASPRATIGLALASRGHALLEGRAYVTPHDVKSMAHEVLRHRLVLTYEAAAAELTADQVIQQILDTVPIP